MMNNKSIMLDLENKENCQDHLLSTSFLTDHDDANSGIRTYEQEKNKNNLKTKTVHEDNNDKHFNAKPVSVNDFDDPFQSTIFTNNNTLLEQKIQDEYRKTNVKRPNLIWLTEVLVCFQRLSSNHSLFQVRKLQDPETVRIMEWKPIPRKQKKQSSSEKLDLINDKMTRIKQILVKFSRNTTELVIG